MMSGKIKRLVMFSNFDSWPNSPSRAKYCPRKIIKKAEAERTTNSIIVLWFFEQEIVLSWRKLYSKTNYFRLRHSTVWLKFNALKNHHLKTVWRPLENCLKNAERMLEDHLKIAQEVEVLHICKSINPGPQERNLGPQERNPDMSDWQV